MSDNINIYAKITGYTKSGKEVINTNEFSVFQTNTETTHRILAGDNPLQLYKDWVKDTYPEELYSIHLTDLSNWEKSHDSEWEIKVDYI